jgi:N-methylhydantoinase A
MDVGGTFTDLVWHEAESGTVKLGKGPSDPADVASGVCDVLTTNLSRERLESSALFLHAHTVGLNALLQRNGASVGLLTTAGFRDVLEIRRGDREVMYDVLWRAREPLVPRWRRLPVRERIGADGTVLQPLDRHDVLAAVAVLNTAAVECIAVVYLNAHANPAHETLTREILLAAGYDGEIALSHEISGEYREFERTSTTVIDAYVRPAVARYLTVLEDRLRAMGFRGKTYVSRSGAGVTDFATGARRPSESIMSGPAAGVVGAASLSRRLGLPLVISADVGGTSFDTSLVFDGQVPLLREGYIDGLPLQTSWVDVRSIGAGGGSLAFVDPGGLLRVGPQSAGAVPGPACYRRGGTKATVTDASAALGMLADGHLAAGVQLDLDLAQSVVAALGRPIGLSPDRAATGVLTVAAASMANAIKTVTVERGIDPRSATLFAYGGAGPLMSTLLARELSISSIVVPRFAGAFSAWGLLTQDITRELSRTRIMRLSLAGLKAANEVLAELFSRLMDDEIAGTRRECALDCRYLGQEYTLSISPPSEHGLISVGATALRALFVDEYRRSFGYELPDELEIVSLRAALRTPFQRDARLTWASGATRQSAPKRVDAWSFSRGARTDFLVFERDTLGRGAVVVGPAIVREQTATTYVDAGFVLCVGPEGELQISRET